MHFGISEGKEGLKHGSRPWLRMDIFWNCPLAAKQAIFSCNDQALLARCPRHIQSVFNMIVDICVMVN